MKLGITYRIPMRVEPREYSSLMNARAFVRDFLMHRKDRLVRFSVTAFLMHRKENIKMGKARYDAIRIAKQLCYSENVINKIFFNYTEFTLLLQLMNKN